MASSEKVISPGVFTNEIDKTFLPAAVSEIGAALIGPTVKGPAMIPTIVNSYGEFKDRFGDTFRSGSSNYSYLTSITARQYLKNSNQLLVIRTLAGSPTKATATISSSIDPAIMGGGTKASASILISGSNPSAINGQMIEPWSGSGGEVKAVSASFGGVEFVFTGSGWNYDDNPNTSTKIYVASQFNVQGTVNSFRDTLNNSSSLHGLNITASSAGNVLTMSFNQVGAFGEYGNNQGASTSGSGWSSLNSIVTSSISMSANNFQGGHDFNSDSYKTVFKLHTLSDGLDMNNSASFYSGTNSLLEDGTSDNIRWEVSSLNQKKGIFSLSIRSGDDTTKNKQILETWNELSLDPDENNFISKRIGDQYLQLQNSGQSQPYLKTVGDYPNKSKYVRVEALQQTPTYLDENGDIRIPSTSGSLPTFHSGSNSGSRAGSFSGGTDGDVVHPKNFYENISLANAQGINVTSGQTGDTAYKDALNLLKNQDEFDINLILIPGIFDNTHDAVVTQAIDVCEERQDCFLIIDPTGLNANLTDATSESDTRNTNYAAMYWPWVKMPEPDLGRDVWVPPSVAVAGMYSFNDRVAHSWYAPAGLNRGVLHEVSRAERKLRQSNRDTLYSKNVNPIATFPGQGTVVWGQKTLQKKASSLDRVNVRRLMIKLKKFIASSTRFLVFEQNNIKTRKRFLNIVNPFLEQVQSQSGLTTFRVVMDATNNTSDIIDRNILYGQIFVQPTRTAEFIVLDFTIQPTGATFPE